MKWFFALMVVAAGMGQCIAGEPERPAGADTPPSQQTHGDYHETIALDEPLDVRWAPQMVQVPVEFHNPCRPETLDLRDSSDEAVQFQVVDPVYRKKLLLRGRIAFITQLGPLQMRSYRLYYDEDFPDSEKETPREKAGPSPLLTRETVVKSVMSAGNISARFLSGSGDLDSPVSASAAPAPIEALKGADGVWRGRGELFSPYKVKSWRADVIASGPVFARARIRYEFTGGHHYELTLTATAGSEWVTVSEDFHMGGRSCFILRGPNCRSEDIGASHPSGTSAVIISRLAAHCQRGATISGLPARRVEPVAAVDGEDLFALFSVAPGLWQNPIGSEINFTRLNGSLTFHFPLEKGMRRWAIHAATLAGGASKNIFRTIRRASDVPMDAVLTMNLARAGRLILIKNPPRDPRELAEAADAVFFAVHAVLAQGFSGPPAQALDLSRVAQAARSYRRLRSAGKTNCPTGSLLRARLAFLGNVLYDPSFFAWNVLLNEDMPPGANFDPESINWLRNVQRFCALADIAAALPDYPRSADWLDHARDQFTLTLKHLVTPWGSWKEGDAKHERARRLLKQLSDTLKASGRPGLHTHPALEAMMKYQPLKE